MGTDTQWIGQILQETYRVEKLIGEGGMGAVFEASHLRLPRRFAIKRLLPALAEHPEALERFQREALIASALGHPHILEVVDFNRTPDGAPYIIMELLEGEDLSARLQRVGRLSLAQATSILQQTTSALQAAHQRAVVHRDLKPHNLFLCAREGRDDFVKVVDFGASKVLSAPSHLTSTQTLIGTPNYMSPEQAEQRVSEVDLRADIYSLGVIVFEMLTGRPPFKADSIPQLLFKVAYHQPPPLRSLRPELPAGVEQVISKALAKKPDDRFGSAQELWQAFAEALPDVGAAPEETTVEVSTTVYQRATAPPPAMAGAPAYDQTAWATAAKVDRPPGAGSTTLAGSAGEVDATMAPRPRSWGRRARLPLLAGGVVAAAAGVTIFLAVGREGPSDLGAPAALGQPATADASPQKDGGPPPGKPDLGAAAQADRSSAPPPHHAEKADPPGKAARPARVISPPRTRPKHRPPAVKKKKKKRIGNGLVDFDD